MIQFGRSERGASSREPDRRPPDYFARGMQWRILLYVFLFLTVLALMFEARKPSNWEWMWQGEAPSSHVTGGTGQGAASRPVATPGRPPLEPEEEEVADGPVVTATELPAAPRGSDNALARTRLSGWTHVLRRLSEHQQDLFQDALRTWRSQEDTGLREADRTSLLARLQANWEDYHARIRTVMDEQRESWTEGQWRESVAVLAQCEARWHAEQEALGALLAGGPLSSVHAATLGDLQRTLDERAWGEVQDNTVFRAAEMVAWQRCWEQLAALSAAEKREADATANYVQLFSQPEAFRGRLIRLRGSVRSAYRVPAAGRAADLKEYVVLGVLLSADSDSPVVVYARDLPAGFPTVGAADQLGRGQPMDVDVEITGIFFKRWLHRSLGGMDLSPLVLGVIDQWRVPKQLADPRSRRVVSLPFMLLAALIVAALASGVAVVVYRSTRWSRAGGAREVHQPAELPAFDQSPVRGTIGASLRELEDDTTPPTT